MVGLLTCEQNSVWKRPAAWFRTHEFGQELGQEFGLLLVVTVVTCAGGRASGGAFAVEPFAVDISVAVNISVHPTWCALDSK